MYLGYDDVVVTALVHAADFAAKVGQRASQHGQSRIRADDFEAGKSVITLAHEAIGNVALGF
jgi:Cu/Ag efflux protein CusF